LWAFILSLQHYHPFNLEALTLSLCGVNENEEYEYGFGFWFLILFFFLFFIYFSIVCTTNGEETAFHIPYLNPTR
jgi:hypothetical protein